MKFKRMAASETKKQSTDYPFRIVMLEIKEGESVKYSSHWEIMPEGKEAYFAYGDYYFDPNDAGQSFNSRHTDYGLMKDPSFEPDKDLQEI